MKNILFLVVLLSSTFCLRIKGQNTTTGNLHNLVNAYVAELRSKGVDTVIVFEDYFTRGQAFTEGGKDWCDTKDVYVPTYILWKQNNKTYLGKKDNCFDYSTMEVNAAAIWRYYFSNQEVIRPEKTKPFQISSTVNGKLSITTITDDHTGHRNLKVIVGNDSTAKFFDTFQLEASTKNGNETLVNANYEHNTKLLSKRLVDMLGDFVVEQEKKKMLIRTRR